jgi:hypothetical protein
VLNEVDQEEDITGRPVDHEVEDCYAPLGKSRKGGQDSIIGHPDLTPSWESIGTCEVGPKIPFNSDAMKPARPRTPSSEQGPWASRALGSSLDAIIIPQRQGIHLWQKVLNEEEDHRQRGSSQSLSKVATESRIERCQFGRVSAGMTDLQSLPDGRFAGSFRWGAGQDRRDRMAGLLATKAPSRVQLRNLVNVQRQAAD